MSGEEGTIQLNPGCADGAEGVVPGVTAGGVVEGPGEGVTDEPGEGVFVVVGMVPGDSMIKLRLALRWVRDSLA